MRLATSLLCVAALLAATPAAWADHTPTPGTVALVGSLQSELGCPGDWQPECPATRLQPVAAWIFDHDMPDLSISRMPAFRFKSSFRPL